jgi:hypothetical protein
MPSKRGKLESKSLIIALQVGEGENPERNHFKPSIGVTYHLDIKNIEPNPDQPRKFFFQEAVDAYS